jgi:hypothetical protein
VPCVFLLRYSATAPRVVARVGLVVCLVGTTALADPVRLHLSGGGAFALGGYQQREFGPGADFATAVEYRAWRTVGLAIQLDGLILSDGREPRNPELANNNGANFGALAAGANVRLPHGFWVGAAGGCGLTGALVRPAASAMLGYELPPEIGVTWGPVVKWVHLFQPDSSVRPEDANVFVAGLHITFGASSSVEETRLVAALE